MGDGLPCFLSGDSFYEKVVEFEARQRQKERTKEAKKHVREDKRKKNNKAKSERFQAAVKVWEEERKAAKAAKQKFTIRKTAQEKLEKPVPRPKPAVAADESSEEEGDEDDDEMINPAYLPDKVTCFIDTSNPKRHKASQILK
jgi:hypothetical protein